MSEGELREFWYLVTPGAALKPGTTRPALLMGHSIILGRRTDGGVFAFTNACPHRGMPMHHGRFDGDALHCAFHGWAFRATDGVCSAIPSLAPGDATDPGRFRLRAWPCREVQGNVWVFAGDGDPGDPPVVPGFAVDAAARVAVTERFPGPVDLAASGFFDPGHPAFVHTSRWWKSNPAAKLRVKEKHFEPDRLGFRMARHHLQHGANPYRLLGRNVHVDISIQLPGLRVESIQGDRHAACVLAAATPLSASETDVHYCVYWTVPWLGALTPAARWMARDFLRQDRTIAVRMMENRAPPAPLFVGDPDAQIRWWLRLKKEWRACHAEGRPFENPIRAQTLTWRS